MSDEEVLEALMLTNEERAVLSPEKAPERGREPLGKI